MALLKFYSKISLFLVVTVMLAPWYFLILFIGYRWRERIGPKLVQFYSKICLSVFHVRIEKVIHYHVLKKKNNGMLIISNHSSFLDIFVLSALFGSVFVSKAEVKSYPVIGQIAGLMGVIFLDRDSSNERLRALNAIVNKCSRQVIAVFPQGTTSRITEQLSFKRGVFKVVELNPDILLLPVTLHYHDDADIAWHKPQSLRENAIKVCSMDKIHIRVTIHKPVTIKDYRERTTSQICKAVEQTVLGALRERVRE
jgi:1-acyl-sn-glycerol-3-phosphate acyltransferase